MKPRSKRITIASVLLLVTAAVPMIASPPCPHQKCAPGARGDVSACNADHRCVAYYFDDTCTSVPLDYTKCVLVTPGDPSYDIFSCYLDPTTGLWVCNTATGYLSSGGLKNKTYQTLACP